MLKKVIEEAFPTVLAFTMSGMYSIVDGIFVGKAAGDTGLAAINIAWPIPALITALGIGIGTGGSVLYSHYRGRGEQKVCENLFELTMTLLIGTGILATILLSLVQKPFLEILGAAGSVQTEAIKYTAIIIAGSILQVAGTGIMPLLRNMNQSLGAMLSMAAGFAVNILVNYYLMFRLNMGIKGAAFGTVTAQAVVVMAGCAILWKTGYRKWRPLWHRTICCRYFQDWNHGIWNITCADSGTYFYKSAVSSLWWKCSGGVLCGYFLYCIPCSVFSDRNRRRCTASD